MPPVRSPERRLKGRGSPALCWALLLWAGIASAAYPDVILNEPGLISYWRMDDSGTTVTDSAGGNNGTLVNGPVPQLSGALSVGPNLAVGFDGADDHAILNASALGTPASITIEAWVRIDESKASGHYHTVVTNSRDDLNDGFIIYINSMDRASATFSGSPTDFGDVGGTTVLTHGVWYHVAATFDDDADVVRLYINGVEEASAPWAGPIFYDPARELRLGAQVKALNESLRYLNGRLDEVAIYSRALTAAEIQEHVQIGRDATAPDTFIDAQFKPALVLSSDDPDATFECSLDGAAWIACTSPHTPSISDTASHQFEARAVDLAGNVDPSPANVTITLAGTGIDGGSEMPPDAGLPLPIPVRIEPFDLRVGCGCGASSTGPALLWVLPFLAALRRRWFARF